jgi:hypothetical protein
MRKQLILGLCLASTALVLVSSCYVRSRSGIGVYADYPLINVDPPAPQYETYGQAPYPGYVWINGYWAWEGGTYQWRAGRWEAPRAGQRWVPHSWRREGNGWRMYGGVWQRY